MDNQTFQDGLMETILRNGERRRNIQRLGFKFKTGGYDGQRALFQKAIELGWSGREPSVLGNFHANEALDEAIAFLLDQPAAKEQL
jgi:hypothetical protein